VTHPVVERLRDLDPTLRRRACLEAAEDPSAVLLVDALVPLLGDPDRGVSKAASDALARIGRGEAETERRLRRALRGETPALRWGAAFTLSRITHPEPGWLPAVVEALGARDGDVRWAAARLLVDMARLDPGVLPVVRGLAGGGDDPAVRRMAVFCLRELAPDDPATRDALLEASRSADGPLRRAAFTALGSLFDPTRAVWDRLAETLAGDPDPASRALAAHAVGTLAERVPGPVPGMLRGLLEDAAAADVDPENDPVAEGLRRAARSALARCGAGPSNPRATGPAPRDGDSQR
jgi:HEAT repeat protein